jgi:hypothetical protein
VENGNVYRKVDLCGGGLEYPASRKGDNKETRCPGVYLGNPVTRGYKYSIKLNYDREDREKLSSSTFLDITP